MQLSFESTTYVRKYYNTKDWTHCVTPINTSDTFVKLDTIICLA